MRRNNHIRLSALSLVVCGLLASCNLNTRGTGITSPIQVDVDPQGPVCPGEPVTVRWDAGGQREDCSRDGRLLTRDACAIVSLTSDDPDLDTRIDLWTMAGELLLAPGRTTRFTLAKRFPEGFTLRNPLTNSVTLPVWPAARESPDDLIFVGDCDGTRPFWYGVDLRTRYGACTRTGQICNPLSYPVTLRDDLGGEETLESGRCTDQYSGVPGPLRPYLTASRDLSPIPTMFCQGNALGGELIEPPDIILTHYLSCLPFDAELRSCIGTTSTPLDDSTSDDDEDTRPQFPCGDGICQPEAGEDSEICPQDCGPEVGPELSIPEGSGLPEAALMVNTDSLCWQGPGEAYPVVSAILQGTMIDLVGIGALPGWLVVDNPRFPEVACWLAEDNVDVDPDLDLSSLEVFPVPSLAEATSTPSPPAAPSNLQVSNKVCDQTEYTITLAWSDNADNEDGYRVYYNSSLIATLGPNTTSFQYTVPSSSAAVYRVEAFNAAGTSKQVSVNEEGCLV